MIDLKKILTDIIEPLKGRGNYTVSESTLSGKIMCGTDIQVSVEYEVDKVNDKRDIYEIKAHPIGEDNQTEIIRALKKLDFGDFELAFFSAKGDWADVGIKHTFSFKVIGDKNTIDIEDIVKVKDTEVKETEVKGAEVKEVKIKKNKFKEVKDYGKSSTNSSPGSIKSDSTSGE